MPGSFNSKMAPSTPNNIAKIITKWILIEPKVELHLPPCIPPLERRLIWTTLVQCHSQSWWSSVGHVCLLKMNWILLGLHPFFRSSECFVFQHAHTDVIQSLLIPWKEIQGKQLCGVVLQPN
uniref:Uncharacterized protein n=1 Tax=Anguilla anguilla TaxID=7936 RepID=A0A0E9X5J7_ANGAN